MSDCIFNTWVAISQWLKGVADTQEATFPSLRLPVHPRAVHHNLQTVDPHHFRSTSLPRVYGTFLSVTFSIHRKIAHGWLQGCRQTSQEVVGVVPRCLALLKSACKHTDRKKHGHGSGRDLPFGLRTSRIGLLSSNMNNVKYFFFALPGLVEVRSAFSYTTVEALEPFGSAIREDEGSLVNAVQAEH